MSSRFKKETCFIAMIFHLERMIKSSSQFIQRIKIIDEKIIQKSVRIVQKIFSQNREMRLPENEKTRMESEIRKKIYTPKKRKIIGWRRMMRLIF